MTLMASLSNTYRNPVMYSLLLGPGNSHLLSAQTFFSDDYRKYIFIRPEKLASSLTDNFGRDAKMLLQQKLPPPATSFIHLVLGVLRAICG